MLAQDRLGDVAAAGLGVIVPGQEHHPDAEIGILEKLVALFLHFVAEKPVGDLGQDAGAVARLGIGVHRAAMDEIANAGQRVAQDFIRALALEAGHEPDAAGVVFESGIVESVEGLRAVEDGLIKRHRE